MKLGLSIGYSGAELKLPVEKVQLAERLGFDSVWTAEAYGSDAITPLAYLAALTKRIRLGTGIMQLAARPPGEHREGAEHRPPIVREGAKPVAVGDAGVSEVIGGLPVALERRHVGAPGLHADGEHRAGLIPSARRRPR